MRNFSEESYTNISKVKIFSKVLHDKVALLTRRCSERGTWNRHQIIFRKVLTYTYRKCWSKDEFLMILMKLRLDFLFSFLQIFLNIFEYIWWSLHSRFLFMGMGNRWRNVICILKLKVIQPRPNIKPEIFQI